MPAFRDTSEVLRYEHVARRIGAPPGPTIPRLVSDIIGFLDDIEIERASILRAVLGGMVDM